MAKKAVSYLNLVLAWLDFHREVIRYLTVLFVGARISSVSL